MIPPLVREVLNGEELLAIWDAQDPWRNREAYGGRKGWLQACMAAEHRVLSLLRSRLPYVLPIG